MSHIQEGLDQSPPSAKSAKSEAYSNEPEGSQNGRPHFERFPMRIVMIPVHPDIPELVRNSVRPTPELFGVYFVDAELRFSFNCPDLRGGAPALVWSVPRTSSSGPAPPSISLWGLGVFTAVMGIVPHDSAMEAPS